MISIKPGRADFIVQRLRIFAALTTASFAVASASEDASLAYFRDLAETRNYTLGRPASTKITPDGKHAIFLRALPRDPTMRMFTYQDLKRFGFTLPEDTPCDFCQQNQGVIRFDHTTNDHAEYTTTP